MSTPALRVEPLQDHPPVLSEEPLPCTVESPIEFSDPNGAYSIGLSSGQLWAIANPKDPPIGASPWSKFVAYREKHRLHPSTDTIRMMAAALTRDPDISEQGARDYLSQYSPGFPAGLDSIQMYLDGWYWGAIEEKRAQREQRRKNWEARRAEDAENIRRYGHLAPSLDI